MEQTPSLTMSDHAAPPTREPTPTPNLDPTTTTTTGTTTAAAAGEGQVKTDPPAKSPTSTDTITDRIMNHGLYTGSLNEEVGQVMGTLTSFWGGLKKQGASAFTLIKKDVDKTVALVQEDFKNLQNAKVEIVRKDSATWEAEQAAEKEKRDAERERKSKGKEKAQGEISVPEGANGLTTATTSSSGLLDDIALPLSATAFLNRLQSSTSQLQQTLQTTFHNTLADIKSNPALSNPTQLRAQLAENLRLSSAKENLQLSFQQAEKLAEEYLKRGEGWVKDAEKWVEENVRVVAPEDGAGNQQFVSMGMDGGDFYSFSTSTPVISQGPALFDYNGGDGGKVKGIKSSLGSAAMAGSRKEALLRRLREDKELLLVDPAGEGETTERKEEFAKWVKDDFEMVFKEQREKEEGLVGGIRMALVPEQLTDEQFWQRYLFHKQMLEAEEQRRKALLQATTQTQQDDFSWDDEPDSPVMAPRQVDLTAISSAEIPTKEKEETSTSTPKSTTPTPGGQSNATLTGGERITNAPAGGKGGAIPSLVSTLGTGAKGSTTTSPRDSEESYDLVSDQGVKKAVPTQEEDEDSDWE